MDSKEGDKVDKMFSEQINKCNLFDAFIDRVDYGSYIIAINFKAQIDLIEDFKEDIKKSRQK